MAFTLPTTGTDPKNTTVSFLETAVNTAIEAVAVASSVGFPLFSSIASGLAGTTDGAGFSVFDTDGLYLYANSAGTEVLQGAVPLAAVTDDLANQIADLQAVITTGRIPRDPVALISTTNLTLSGEQTIDGTLTSASRVAVAGQTDPAENGVYVTASGAWTRASDMDAGGEINLGTVFVLGGSANGGTSWTFVVADPDTFVLGTDDITATKVADSGALQDYLDAEIVAVNGTLDARVAPDAAVSKFEGEASVVFAVGGPNGNAGLALMSDGTLMNAHITAIEDTLEEQSGGARLTEGAGTAIIAIGGPDGKAGFAVLQDGTIRNAHITRIDTRLGLLETASGTVQGGLPESLPLGPVGNFMHAAIYSQSLGVGEEGSPPRSTSALSWARRFVGGVISYLGVDPGRYASLENLNEITRESIATSMWTMVQQLLQAENGIAIADTGLIGFATSSGFPGRTALELSSGTTHFDRLELDIEQAKARADDAGLAHQAVAMPYLQGEADYTSGTAAATWKTRVIAIREDAEAHAQSVSGIDRPLPMILYQLSQHVAKSVDPTLGLAAVELCEEEDYIGFATPMYFIPAVDTAHRDADGYFWLGAYFGLALKRWMFDGVKPMPMSPADVIWWDEGVSLRFPTQVGGLVLDTTMVTDPGDYGFELFQSDGTTPVSITSVAIAGPDRVVIRAAAIPAGARLRYAWSAGPDIGGPREGPTNGARGNLRDSQGDIIIADPYGSAFPLHQWAPIFEETRP